MARAALLVALALLGGCEKLSSNNELGSPGGSVAGTEAQQDDRPRAHTQDLNVAQRSGVASSLIAVSTTTASEAQPCERVCGSLGDCLLADADDAATAAGLELMCLDMCVHSDEAAPAKAEFLACGTQTECGPLRACAERTWTALADARQQLEITGVIASGNTCLVVCTWMYSCISANTPPGQAPLDPDFERIMQESCVEPCEQMPNRESWGELPACFANNCSFEGVYHCVDEVNL